MNLKEPIDLVALVLLVITAWRGIVNHDSPSGLQFSLTEREAQAQGAMFATLVTLLLLEISAAPSVMVGIQRIVLILLLWAIWLLATAFIWGEVLRVRKAWLNRHLRQNPSSN